MTESALEKAEGRSMRSEDLGEIFIMRAYFRGQSGKVTNEEEKRLGQRGLLKVQCRPGFLMALFLEQFTKPYPSALPTQLSLVSLLPSPVICTNHFILSLCQTCPERGLLNSFPSVFMDRELPCQKPHWPGAQLWISPPA